MLEFICTQVFDRSWNELGLTDEDQRQLELRLIDNPKAGVVIPHTNGARKLRIEAKGHGKSGGARVIYVNFVVDEEIYFLDVYGKGVKEDLEEAEKQAISKLIRRLADE